MAVDSVPLEAIVCTDEFDRRPSRPPDYQAENLGLVALCQALADAPHAILQTLAEKILEILGADSAGISLLTADETRFYWPAIAGVWRPHIGGGTPRDFGPCGDVLDHDAPMVFTHVERRYTYFLPVTPPIEECLLVPFYVEGKAVGTIWAISHDKHHTFDAEDLRQLVSLGQFASAAHQVRELLQVNTQAEADAAVVAEELRYANQRLVVAGLTADARAERATHDLGDLNALLATLTEGVVILDAGGRVLLMNDAARVIWDIPENPESPDAPDMPDSPDTPDIEESLKRGAAQLRAVEGGVLEHDQWPTVRARGGERFAEEEYALSRGGRLLRIVSSGSAINDLRGNVELAIVTFRDVTQLRRLDKLREEYAALISHDLRNPLTIVMGRAGLLRRLLSRSDAADPEWGEFLGEIEAGAGRMNTMIDDILDSSYLDSSQAKITNERLDMAGLIAAAVGATAEPARMNVTVAADLPPVLADSARIERVLVNLLTNALKYSEAGSPISIVAAPGDGEVVVSVADRGSGIPEDQLPQLFDRYYRVTAVEHGRAAGYGLGLYVARLIVEAQGGRIWAESELGQGSTFRFTLPTTLASDG